MLSTFIKSSQQLIHLVQTKYKDISFKDIFLFFYIKSCKRDIKLFGRDIKLSEQVNYVVRTRYYVVITT